MPLFTVAEARVFDRQQLADAARYPDALLTEAELRIREKFERVCDLAFVKKTGVTVTVDGTGTEELRLPLRELSAVTSGRIDGVSLTVTELADLAVYPTGRVVRKSSYWTRGNLNVALTVSYGLESVPYEIKDAALRLLQTEVISSDVPRQADTYSIGGATWSSIAGSSSERPTSLPEVNAVLMRYVRPKVG